MNAAGVSLTHPFSPYERMCQVDQSEIQSALRQVFSQWGQPKSMKFDNGKPFGDPQKLTVPWLALWLIGLGIKVIYNRPRMPQDNAKVERSQGTTERWGDTFQCVDYEQLRRNLKDAVITQREQYPVKRLAKKTRLEAFPDLAAIKNKQRSPYCPGLFDIQKVYHYLIDSSWGRKLSENGQLNFWGTRYTVGKKYKSQMVTVTMDAPNQQWLVRDDKANIIYRIEKPFSVKQLCHISKCQGTE